MTTSPRKIGPLIPIVAVALLVVAAVIYDSWTAPGSTDPSPLIEHDALNVPKHQRIMPPMPPPVEPFIPGYPTMTREAADASFELQIAYLRDVLGKDVPTTRNDEREVWAQALIAEYPNLSPVTRAEIAESPNTLARFKAGWGQLNPEERARIREEARVSGAVTGPDAVLARYLAEGLRAQMYRSSVRGWAGFLIHLRAVPLGDPRVATVATVDRGPFKSS